jgi:hypothetical protein
MPTISSLRFQYGIPAKNAAFMVFGVLLGPVGAAYLAMTFQRPLRILGVITLTAQGSTNFFWVIFAIGAIVALIVIFVAIRSQISQSWIELSDQDATLPKAALLSPLIRVPYGSIREILVVTVSNQPMVIVKSSLGECRILLKYFNVSEDYAVFLYKLRERCTVL